MKAHINLNGRIECNDIEFSSGDLIEILIANQWIRTRIEHNGQQYYSIDGYDLTSHQIRPSNTHFTHHLT